MPARSQGAVEAALGFSLYDGATLRAGQATKERSLIVKNMKPTAVVGAMAILFMECGMTALACDYETAYGPYRRALVAYRAGDYKKAYDGARVAAAKIRVCLKTDDPKDALTQEEWALWDSFLIGAADAGSRMSSYPTYPTRAELRSLVETAIYTHEQVLASPYAGDDSKATIRSDLPKYRRLLARL